MSTPATDPNMMVRAKKLSLAASNLRSITSDTIPEATSYGGRFHVKLDVDPAQLRAPPWDTVSALPSVVSDGQRGALLGMRRFDVRLNASANLDSPLESVTLSAWFLIDGGTPGLDDDVLLSILTSEAGDSEPLDDVEYSTLKINAVVDGRKRFELPARSNSIESTITQNRQVDLLPGRWYQLVLTISCQGGVYIIDVYFDDVVTANAGGSDTPVATVRCPVGIGKLQNGSVRFRPNLFCFGTRLSNNLNTLYAGQRRSIGLTDVRVYSGIHSPKALTSLQPDRCWLTTAKSGGFQGPDEAGCIPQRWLQVESRVTPQPSPEGATTIAASHAQPSLPASTGTPEFARIVGFPGLNEADLPGLFLPLKAIGSDGPVVAVAGGNVGIDACLALVLETRLSFYPSRTGAGRVVHTMGLFPGEETSISITTYRHRTTELVRSSSIVDSYTSSAAQDFQQRLESEQQSSRDYTFNQRYAASVHGEASWGWGEASVDASGQWDINVSTQAMAHQINNATRAHSSSASLSRNIEVDSTSRDIDETSTTEAIVRTVKNINVSRTLNFFFYQLNQEFLSFVHATDIKLGYFSASNGSRMVPLVQADQLLDEVISDLETRRHARESIRRHLGNLKDVDGNSCCSQAGNDASESAGFLHIEGDRMRVDGNYVTHHRVGDSDEIRVPGLVLAHDAVVMRTDNLYIDSIIGQLDALDAYSSELQKQDLRSRQVVNDADAARTEALRAGLELVRDGKHEAAAALAMLLHGATQKNCDTDD